MSLSMSRFYEDGSGNLWLRMHEKQFLWDEQSKSITHFPFYSEKKDSFKIAQLLRDSEGTLWVSHLTGIAKYDSSRKTTTQYHLWEPGFINYDMVPIWEDSAGTIWVAPKGSLVAFNKKTEQSKRYPYFVDTLENNLLPTTYGVIWDNDQVAWVASNDGLFRLNIKTGETKAYEHDQHDSSSLSHNYITSICPDPKQPDNVLWLGTRGGGLNRFDKQTGKFTHIDTRHGLSLIHI